MSWPKIARLMEVSIVFNICRYCVFTWWIRSLYNIIDLNLELLFPFICMKREIQMGLYNREIAMYVGII